MPQVSLAPADIVILLYLCQPRPCQYPGNSPSPSCPGFSPRARRPCSITSSITANIGGWRFRAARLNGRAKNRIIKEPQFW